ncbi:hypothetical protein L6452_42177 [Arctium lappa]|uniref:Uncharacterized protein n=1 Tax=Arctium lappa TaxID=4217 RepID=A0ACB8XHI5_ARCLA|nr:hypothetical protein L6452_42177 [Arctium lappa]
MEITIVCAENGDRWDPHTTEKLRRLENRRSDESVVENVEIRAEMEASKLSASASVTMCLEVARTEKKYLKRLLAWEKQWAKLQEDITVGKQKIIEFQEELLQAEAAKKTAESFYLFQECMELRRSLVYAQVRLHMDEVNHAFVQ